MSTQLDLPLPARTPEQALEDRLLLLRRELGRTVDPALRSSLTAEIARIQETLNELEARP